MPKLVKRMPRFARKVGGSRYSMAEGAPSSLWAHLLTSRAFSGAAIDPQGALSLAAYYAGVRVISEDVASLPVAVYKAKKSGGTTLVDDHPVTVLLERSPVGEANETTSLQWREAWIAHCLGWGNGFAEIEWTRNYDEALGLHLMHPDRTKPVRDRAGKLWYEDNSDLGNGGVTKKLAASDVLHLAGLGFNGLQGYSPVALARGAIGLGRAAEEFGASLFANGAVPKGYLKYPGKLSEAAVANLRANFNAKHQGSQNANKVAVLEEGMDWVNTQINPDDAQFLATRQFQVVEIARILRLPPHKIGDYTQSHLSNIEASNLDYLMTCLRPWCVRVEQCLGLKLLSDKEHRLGYYVRHDLRALLRAAIKDRAFYYKAMFEFGMSPNEIFELEDMNPIPEEDGGNMRFRTIQSVPLSSIPAGTTAAPGISEESTAPTEPADDASATGPSTYSHRQNGRFSHQNGVI